NDLCLENKASLFMMLQSLVKVLFHRYTGQTDIILGSPIAGRVHEDLENQIGFYVNTLSLRDSIEGNLTFNEFLESVKKTCTDAFDNQDYPFDSLVEELDIKRDMSRSPLFDVMVVLQNNDEVSVEIEGLNLSPYNTENTISKFDMTFNFSETGEGLFCDIEYNTDIYSEDIIRRMVEHIITLISSVISNPFGKIKDLEIITEDEKNLLLTVYNDTKTDNFPDKSIVDLFEEQVDRIPDNIAVVFENVELTYRELNERANMVGHYLRDNYDIQSNDLIGLFMDKSEKMIISLLGILKSGAAYIPIDRDYPQSRIDYMLEDSKPILVIGEENKDLFIDYSKIFDLSCKNKNLKKNTTAEDLAYVIYTSGSTGKPKGTLISNSTVINFFRGIKEKIDFREGKTIVSVTSVSFDIFVTETFLPLSLGQKIILANKEQQQDPFALKELIDNNQVDMIQSTPSRIKMLTLEDSLLETLSRLTEIMVGGEAFPDTLLKIMNKHCHGKIYNMYGPTESTIWSSLALLNGEKSVNIGKPIVNTQIYILDQNQKLLPQGVSGELYISGSGLARGYLNRPELTAEKFVDNPFIPGKRMYRTGDLARWLSDGNIKFLGRIDNQVKIRGFRIELEEIENSLVQHDDISFAEVLAKDGIDGDKRLVAYIVSDTELEMTVIRSFLKESLPDYMLPSYFIQIDEFPLTPNGKIDRNALPEPDGLNNSGHEYAAPRNEIEEKLVEIWQEVLNVERISILDEFFDLGGHSLKAVKIITRISKELEIEVSIKEIFVNQTIESLSEIIQSIDKKEYKRIENVGEKDHYELSNAQKRLWVINQNIEENNSYNMPFGYIIRGFFDEEAFKRSYSYIINRHESLRTVIVTVNGEPRQKILEKPNFVVNFIDLRNSINIDDKVKKIADLEISTEFDLENGPLVRFSILRLEEEKSLIFFNMHHIISDGWSMNLFSKEFLIIYNSYRNNNEPVLEELRIQYKDYSAWQNKLLSSQKFNDQRKYWLDKLSGELPILNLQADKTRPIAQTYNGNSCSITLEESIRTKILLLSKKYNVSLFMLFQTFIKILFYRYTGQEDIIIGSAIAGREHKDLENQIGFFVNMLAIRDNINHSQTFAEVLENIKNSCNEAFDNQSYPFDILVDDLEIRRDISRSPIFDVGLTLQNNESSAIELEGLEITEYERENITSKFDLLFNITEFENLIDICIEFNTDIYFENRISRMSKHLKTLILSIIDNPETMVQDLEIIPEKEKDFLHNINNENNLAYPKDKTIIDLFEEQVEKTPDSIAVVFEEIELTYRELNDKANIIGHYLRDNFDIKPDDLIGVLLTRSEKVIIAFLGILKSGAAYVPLDPSYPQERIDFILNDSSPKTVICEKDYENYVNINSALEVVTTNKNLEYISNSNNLAYVIYTSGSTGKPKGSLIENRNVVRLFYNEKAIFNFSEKDIWTIFHSFCFDFSVWEMYGALLFGGKSIILSEKYTKDPYLLLDLLENNQVTILNQTPASFYNLSDLAELKNSRLNLKYIIFGGEALNISKLDFWFNNYTNCKLINMYGITETTVHVTYKEITEEDIKKDICNIGNAIPTLSTYILDKNKKMLPIGIPGEICVTGDGVCRGYLNRDELTSKKFISNPFNREEKMYLSGDCALRTESGELVYLGRLDNQVKIRGHRIEIGEIESNLLKIEYLSDSLVRIVEDENGNKSLCAYYIVNSNDVKDKEIEDQNVENWQGVFDNNYYTDDFLLNPQFVFNGWNSSYTGNIIDTLEMKEWVINTVDRIKLLEPQSVYEIGFGSGLLLYRIAPSTDSYLGIDFSEQAVSNVSKVIDSIDHIKSKTKVYTCEADNFIYIQPYSVDTVVINSVAQYFPSIEYFNDIIEKSIECVKENGAIFIGDLRNYNLIETFHTSINLFQINEETSVSQLRKNISNSIDNDNELLISPEFFYYLQSKNKRISHIEIKYKKGHAINELTNYRYDVVLHIEKEISVENSIEMDWNELENGLSDIKSILDKHKPDQLYITNIVNSRIERDCLKEQLIKEGNVSIVKDIFNISEKSIKHGLDYIQFEDLGKHDYFLDILWAGSNNESLYNVVFIKNNLLSTKYKNIVAPRKLKVAIDQDMTCYANKPIQVESRYKYNNEIKRLLKENLPEYMIPSYFIKMDSFPLTLNGKIDIKALPEPEEVAVNTGVKYISPHSEIEKILAKIWKDVLRSNIEIGID
ncbi:MAG: amino acid adenylation domain-containing protein, partial [bacterium]|nr:amino acid adenylation domain-containing protein [bacterium]